MKLNIALPILLLIPQVILAQSFSERATQTYLATDKNFDIDCYYSYNKSFKLITPVEETKRGPNTLSRSFRIEAGADVIPMSFLLNREGKKLEYRVTIDEKHVSQGKLRKREFYIAPIADKAFSEKYETSRIYCHVNFAYAYPHPLVDGNYHFNVHPHKKYDWQGKLKDVTEKYLNDGSFNSIIFLETGNYRGNLVNIHSFLDGRYYSLPATDVDTDLENVPANVPLVVSPAGNNRFDFKAKDEINITFTGGNHNYCIWNVTRHVIESLMQSKSSAKVNFNYDMAAIVAQVRGIERMGLNFNRSQVNRSNLLRDLLIEPEVQEKYHSAYLYFFKHYIASEYAGMFRTYKINYRAEGFNSTLVIPGNGERDLEVSFQYL